MNRVVIAILVGIGILVGVGALTARSDKPAKHDSQAFAMIQADVARGAKFYDVRTSAEYASGHFASTTNFPLQELQAGKLPEISKNTKIYVHCHTGNRSAQAAAILRQSGFTNVDDLGGIASVQSLGGVLVK